MSDNLPDPPDRDLLEVEALLRSLDADDLSAPPPPPPGVWAAIQSELTESGDLVAPATPTVTSTPVVSLAEHRSRRLGTYRWLAAAAVVAVVAGAIAVVATRGGDPSEVVATAQLTWDPEAFNPLGADASARAELVQRDGGYEIVLDDAVLPAVAASGADLELWMISTDADGEITDVQPVSLVDPSDPGTYAVPSNLDPDTYTVVDISIEPRDGDTAHSGESILRGTLST